MLLAGEASGDRLGAELIAALKEKGGARGFRFSGIGGELMIGQGLKSLFALEEITTFGFAEALRRLPLLLSRIRQTAAAASAGPDLLVLIDSPDFTHRVARRARRVLPDLPIINYPPPAVWAWRPSRARRMKGYISKALSVFPFEPDVFRELDGPDCVYVGHPALSRRAGAEAGRAFRARSGIAPEARLLLVAPGSRPHEIRRLIGPFGEAAARLSRRLPDLRVVLPAAGAVIGLIEAALADWPLRPVLVRSEADKYAALAAADCALAASGTINMELAAAGTPFICAYRLGAFEGFIARRLLRKQMICQVNFTLERFEIPEYLQGRANGPELAEACAGLFSGPAREAQLAALTELNRKLEAGLTTTPAREAAREVLALL